MNFASKLALAAVLSLGTTALTVAPAAAQKKDDKKADPNALKVSDEFRKPAAVAEAAVKAKDWATAEPSIVTAEAAAKNDDEKYYAAWLRLQLELSRGNENAQIPALQILSVNPRTAPDAKNAYNARLNFLLGKAAASQKKHAEVITYMAKARELGEKNLDIPLMMANAYAATGKNVEAAAEARNAIEAAKATGQKAPEAWYQFAIPKAIATGNRETSYDWLAYYLKDYPTVKNWRWAIEVLGQGAKGADRAGKIERIDLYRLRRITNSLADRGDYADYAYAAQSSGLPWEAISVIEEGRKNGKLPTTDPDGNRTFTAAQAGVKSSPSLATLASQGGVGNADALLAAGDNENALKLYDAALAKGGDANEINLHRGIALQRLGRKDEAKTAFQAVKTGPFVNVALLWQVSLDTPPLS
ncbi:putative Zn-dependent protease [Sphingomonas kyeonggiensis]|uniref:tetratricopeptide repeat protein n=1 Tax=Sphingomonas kyeonggiensis TaxID=1268553 RepID=UPI00278802AE|nr:tetratricopeptide repeat protein [Sphingomonas kyeonggiensis]MDQ0250792.1 putative Zn-dependent protease [Sphingomonas kyeonggiensis]